jgi:outer membrane protein TolC
MTRTVVGFVVLLVCARPASAQDTPAIPLTLDQAIQRAIDHSHRLVEAEARGAGARAAVQSSEAAEKPNVFFTAGYLRTNFVEEFGVPQPDGATRVIYPDIPDNYYMRASMQWPIYTGGRTDALIRAAEAEASAAAADIEVARADLRLEVTRAYWALVTATDTVRVVEQGLTRADAHLRDVRSRFDNGLIPPNDVSAVEAQRAREEMLLIEARNREQSTLEDLRRLTGVAGQIIPAEPLQSVADITAPMDTAGQRAELVALDRRIEAADDRAAAIVAGRRPTLSFITAADYANPNPRRFPRAELWQTSWEVGVSGSWTLWDGGRVAADTAEAEAAARALRARHADVSALIDSEVRQRRLDLDSARAALVAASAAVTSAADARRVVNERFNVGVATSTELLDAHLVLLQAELDRTRALANIRLAEARLARALGR